MSAPWPPAGGRLAFGRRSGRRKPIIGGSLASVTASTPGIGLPRPPHPLVERRRGLRVVAAAAQIHAGEDQMAGRESRAAPAEVDQAADRDADADQDDGRHRHLNDDRACAILTSVARPREFAVDRAGESIPGGAQCRWQAYAEAADGHDRIVATNTTASGRRSMDGAGQNPPSDGVNAASFRQNRLAGDVSDRGGHEHQQQALAKKGDDELDPGGAERCPHQHLVPARCRQAEQQVVTFAQATISVSRTIETRPPSIIDIQPRSPGGVTVRAVRMAERSRSVAGWSRSIRRRMRRPPSAACARSSPGLSRPMGCSQRCVRSVRWPADSRTPFRRLQRHPDVGGESRRVMPPNVPAATPTIVTG